MAVIDIFTYNGERDVLDIHLNVLKDHVDQFIICEAPITFTGKQKPLYFKEVEHLYTDFPIKYYVIDENDPELWEMARNSPNTQGAEHWKREFFHKESIKKALTHLKDDDVCFIGDVDEVWRPVLSIYKPPEKVTKIMLKVYTYYLNNKSSEKFLGTIVGKYKDIKNECLNHLRSNPPVKSEDFKFQGWHFTSMGGLSEFARKLGDSYTAESYFTKEVQDTFENNFGHRDFLGRGFTFTKDESDWPQYLKDNKEKYKHLWKQ
jgi:beta-1,4-mannosyl-glycoprotein beta-1,4-N-acetylglucosaminyltransferase